MGWVVEQKSLELDSIAQDVVSAQPGLVLLEAREWTLPAAIFTIAVKVSGYRRCHLVEEFIIKCIGSGLPELKTLPGIAGLLKLDEVLVKECLSLLVRHGLVTASPAGGDVIYDLPEGKQNCQTTQIPLAFWTELRVSVNAQYGIVEPCRQNADKICLEGEPPVFRYCRHQEEQTKREHFQLSREQADYIFAKQGQGVDVEEANLSIAEMVDQQFVQEQQRTYGEIWVYDPSARRVLCRVWDFRNNTFSENLAGVLIELESEQRQQQAQAAAKNDAAVQALKQLEAQLLAGHIADETKCIAWFEALLGLSEHNYIREMLAEEALEQVVAGHSLSTMLKLLGVYVAAEEYQIGFNRLLEFVMRQEDHSDLIQWLEQLYAEHSAAYASITSVYRRLAGYE